jgi:hypothetical protein
MAPCRPARRSARLEAAAHPRQVDRVEDRAADVAGDVRDGLISRCLCIESAFLRELLVVGLAAGIAADEPELFAEDARTARDGVDRIGNARACEFARLAGGVELPNGIGAGERARLSGSRHLIAAAHHGALPHTATGSPRAPIGPLRAERIERR